MYCIAIAVVGTFKPVLTRTGINYNSSCFKNLTSTKFHGLFSKL